MTVFFTSDTHFGHSLAFRLRHRPFSSLAAMDEAMIARWNEAVGPDDDVWHLGDFAGSRDPALGSRILARIAGRKRLIVGNNDGPDVTGLPDWESVGHYTELELEGTLLVLCHYPFRTWNGMYKGALNLHDHSHGRLSPMPRQVDVGVDVWNFRPVTLAEIVADLKSRRHNVRGPVARPEPST